MKRIIWHWSAGGYKATKLDKKHYHEIFEGTGKRVLGDNPISANKRIVKGKPYAAHTRGTNTGSIGLSMACMRGAKERPLSYGPSPMTEKQFEAMMKRSAELSIKYNIPVTNKTMLSHAEVQPNLGIKQRGKWDFTVLPFQPELKGAKACGDYARSRVKHYIKEIKGVKTAVKKPKVVKPKVTKPIKKIKKNSSFLSWLRRVFKSNKLAKNMKGK